MAQKRAHSRGGAAAELVAEGVWRVGDWMVNLYLVEDEGRLTVVDAGLPGMYGRLRAALEETGHRLGSIDAVVLTHGHPDHVGLAERVRQDAGAAVWVHEDDDAMVADPRHATRYSSHERSFGSYLLRRPATLRVPLHIGRQGGFRPVPVQQRSTFRDGDVLDVPGRPTAVLVPGHTHGSTAFVFADRGVVMTGDALVTRDDITGRDGPTTVPAAFTHDSAQALASLTALARSDIPTVLPGHGPPFTGGAAAAVALARAAGPA